MSNAYCEALGIRVPALEAVRDHPEASPYTLLLVALLERGSPMTLPEVAERFARANVAPADAALRSLKRVLNVDTQPVSVSLYALLTHVACGESAFLPVDELLKRERGALLACPPLVIDAEAAALLERVREIVKAAFEPG